MGVLDIVKSIVGNATDPKAALDAALFGIQNELGKFLSSGNEILTVKNKADAYLKAPDSAVKIKAQEVSTKAGGLLSNLKSIQGSALNTINEANTTRNRMESDPLWKGLYLGNFDWSSLGYETAQKLKLAIGQVSGVIGDLSHLVSQMEDHLSDVADLKSDMTDLDNLAQGKGIANTAGSILGKLGAGVSQPLTDILKPAAMIGVGIIAFAYVLPQLISGTASGIRKARRG
jgi:hypothetical protein